MKTNKCFECKNNKGFSFVELIVVIAILVIMTGAVTLSLSLLTGSEAKQAAQKFSSQIDEVKTGNMSRFSEDLSIVYVADPSAYDWADKEGYYVVKEMKTMGATATEIQDPSHPEDSTKKIIQYEPDPNGKRIGVEHRYICNNRVSMEFEYEGGSAYEVLPDGNTGFTLTFDRSTGLYDKVGVDTVLDGSGECSITLVDGSYPKTLKLSSGLRTYTIEFVKETGKHNLILN